MKNFNKTLKNYFAGQGLTQSDVAERLQISRTVATNYLNGYKTMPHPSRAEHPCLNNNLNLFYYEN